MADVSEPTKPKLSAGNTLARRWWLNVALLVIVAALGALVWYRSAHIPAETRTSLTEIDPTSIRRLEIERPKEAPASLERHDDEWRLVAPFKARADALAVESLLQLARAPIDATITPADGDLARYGLDHPLLTIRLDDTAIRFGQMHPLKDECYVQVGNAVHLIAGHYYAQAAARPTNYIDSRLIEPGRKLVTLKLPGFALRLDDGTWRREPEIATLSSDKINAFVDDWRHGRALQVEKSSGRKTRETIEIGFEEANGHRSTLTIGVLQREPELVLARSDEGLEYHFPKETAQRLLTLNADAKK